jgi:hypothetical protein
VWTMKYLFAYNQSNACDVVKGPPEVNMHSVFLDRLATSYSWHHLKLNHGFTWNFGVTVKLLCNANCKCHMTFRFLYDVCSTNM